MSSGAPRFGVVPVLCNHVVWQSSDMTYPAVNEPNITSGFTFNKRSLSLASELRCFVVLRPSPEQSAPSAARYNTFLTWEFSSERVKKYINEVVRTGSIIIILHLRKL